MLFQMHELIIVRRERMELIQLDHSTNILLLQGYTSKLR